MASDTIKEFTTHYALSSAEVLLVGLESALYALQIKRVQRTPAGIFIDTFNNSRFETENVYDNWMGELRRLSSELLGMLTLAQLPFAEFEAIYRIYCSFREHPHLRVLVDCPEFQRRLSEYVGEISARVNKTNKDD